MQHGATLIRAAAFCAFFLSTGCAVTPAPVAHTDVALLVPPHPTYPPELEAVGVEGSVAINCTVNAAGSTEACVVASSTDHRFDTATLAAIRAARYLPATENGIPVQQTRHTFRINYRLRRQSPLKVTGRFDCDGDSEGHVHGCTTPDGKRTQEELLMMTGFIHSLSVAPRVLNGQPVEDPHRVIEVWMIVTPVIAAESTLMLPSSDVQVDYLLSCKRHGTAGAPRCSRIAAAALPAAHEPTFGEDETEQPSILRVSLGLSGYLPVAP